MRIAMFTNTYTPHVGGVARSIKSFVQELRARGHEVLIVCPDFQDAPKEEQGVIRMPAIQHFNGTDFSVVLPVPNSLRQELDRFHPQIIHSHHPFLLGDSALRLAAEMSLPLVFTHHTLYEQYTHYTPADSSQLKHFVIDLVTGYANLCNAVIAPSESIEILLRERKVETPLHVVPSGIDPKLFSVGSDQGFKNAVDLPSNSLVIGHVGRLAPEKNLTFLCKAVAEAMRIDPRLYFLVVGDGPSRSQIEHFFHEKHLEQRLRLAGTRSGDELVQAYRSMDVFVFSSYSETQGLVLLEAMACGLPVVALDASGVRDVLKDGQAGRLIQTENLKQFAEAIIECLDKRSHDIFSESARNTADLYSVSNCTSRLLSLYQGLQTEKINFKDTQDSAWWVALKRIEAEWAIWSNVGGSLVEAVAPNKHNKVRSIFRLTRSWISNFTRNQIAPRLRGLGKRSLSKHSKPGLIMIQIDGLSRSQFEAAVANRKLPFLRKLLTVNDFKLTSLYSGLPSTTPAVQAELFFGHKCAVPAFAYYDSKSNNLLRMYETEIARKIERELSADAQGLLSQGSSYSNIYIGGALKAHFCAAATGWNKLLGISNPFKIFLAVVLYLRTVFRIILLILLELVIGAIEMIRGWVTNRQFFAEFKFLPARIAVSIILRELITLGASLDIARGLPIIHLNYLGYDEQSHRRGPKSAYAHWALKGIDRCIRYLWFCARNSRMRKYTLCIYSDHGQETVIPYSELYKQDITEAISKIFKQTVHSAITSGQVSQGVAKKRSRFLASTAIKSENPLQSIHPEEADQEVKLAAMGPLGHIYLPTKLSGEELDCACQALVSEAKIPLVMRIKSGTSIRAWTENGVFDLPSDLDKVLGEVHQFADEVGRDLINLCNHTNAGDIIISGWRPKGPAVSFVTEAGAHGGPGTEETHAFVLLPSSTPGLSSHSYLRPKDLREIALQLLGRSHTRRSKLTKPRRHPESLRIMTYNVHSCVGTDGALDIGRIAQVIEYYNPDVIALQELDVGRVRTSQAHQVRELARLLRMHSHFHPAYKIAEEEYGNAILSIHPMRLKKAEVYPQKGKSAGKREPRGALWVEIDLDGTALQVFNTHLGLRSAERLQQISTLLSSEWLGSATKCGPLILCGDFNAFPQSRVYKTICKHLNDVQSFAKTPKFKTWHAHMPISSIDHIFVSEEFEALDVAVPRTHLTRQASDHLPIIADLRLKRESKLS